MRVNKTKHLLIGIDPGVRTGIAIYNTINSKFVLLETMSILKAFKVVKEYSGLTDLVIVEDARKVRYKLDYLKAQGAGSIKRDCQIWEEYLFMLGLDFIFVRPKKSITKLNNKIFAKITGYTGKTNEHSRDAGMLVYARKIKK